MKKLYLLILAVTLIFGSCSVRSTTSREIKTAPSSVYQKKLIADLEVDITKKITGSAVVKIKGADQVDLKLGKSKTLYERAMNMAKWDAVTKANADAIADPIYNINQSGSTVTVEVQGFYGKYKSIDIATNDDLMLYIETKLSMGTGILGITFAQFQSFYELKYKTYDIPEDQKLSEYELEELYDSYVQQALQMEKTAKTTKHGKSGKGKKILLTYLGIGAVITLITVIL